RLENTGGVDLTRMYIGSTFEHGVRGTGMTDPSPDATPTFGFHHGVIDGVGSAPSHAALSFVGGGNNIIGQLVVDNSTIRNLAGNGLSASNIWNTLDVEVTSVVFEATAGAVTGRGIEVEAVGDAVMNVDVTSSEFRHLTEGGVAIAARDFGVVDANVVDNLDFGSGWTGTSILPLIALVADGSFSNLTFDVSGNRLFYGVADGISLGEEGTLTGRIDNNHIAGLNGVGIRVDTAGTNPAVSRIEIAENQVGPEVAFEGDTYAGLANEGIYV